MKIYRLTISEASSDHCGYEYCRNMKEVKKEIREQKRRGNTCEIDEVIEFKPTKGEIVSILNQYGGHADNG